jgi:flagellin-like protein
MLKRLLTQKRYFKNIYKEQKGITGLETAIILIAFVVVAAVFAYTVLSAGLFSTQKSQEAVYSGLAETQNTIDIKGAVVANGAAMLNNCDYTAWVGTGTTVATTITRETTEKWEGSASMKAVIAAGALINEDVAVHAMQAMDLTNGDTINFWIKADAALDSNISFVISANADLTGATETYVINTAGTGWEKHSVDLTGGNDDTAVYYGIVLSTDAAGTFYLDNVMFDDVASQNGIPCILDNCDFPLGWVADGDATVARDTDAADKVEGTGAISCVIAAGMAQDDEPMYHAMTAKSFLAGDTITFWAKASDAAALDNALTFHLATGTDLNGTSTQALALGDISTTWAKHTMTLAGDDTGAVYYGLSLSADAAGTIYIDDIEISNAGLNNNNDPMNAFANQVSFTVGLATNGDGVDFTSTSDADGDGLLSDESTKSHKVIIYYNDEYQQAVDLAWTKTAIGKDDGDNILDVGEKFQITVDLTYINQNSGVWASSKIGNNQTFALEVKPPTGAVLTLERTMPPKVGTINNLN